MKRYLIFLTLFNTCLLSVQAQTTNWVAINNPIDKYSFSLPGKPLMKDTLQVRFYSYQVDSLLSFQVHQLNNAELEPNVNRSQVLEAALQQSNNDTLRAMIRLMLSTSNADLLSIEDVLVSSKKGIEAGILYKETDTNNPSVSFIRLFYFNKRFISFNVSGTKNDIMRLQNNKTIFFNSISFQ
jgi:hypothetical protein